MKYYNSAKEFAEAIKKEYYEYEQDAEDMEMRREAIKKQYRGIITEDALNSMLNKEFSAIDTKYQEVIDCILTDILAVIPSSIKDFFREHFYITTVDTKMINARIARSPDKKYFGIFINSSLITLLSKVGKLDAAMIDSNCIVYCNRFPNSRPSYSDLVEMRDEMYSYFIQYKMAHGPFLIIEGEAAAYHFARLNILEKFIIFHEIAHFLNGDLLDNMDQKLIHPFTNLFYQREHLADLLAFALILKSESMKIEKDGSHLQFLIFSLIHLFDIMYGLQSEQAGKHPHPLDRLMVIIEGYFGIEVADIIEKKYYDRHFWFEFQSYSLKLKFDIKKIQAMVDKSLLEAFNKMLH